MSKRARVEEKKTPAVDWFAPYRQLATKALDDAKTIVKDMEIALPLLMAMTLPDAIPFASRFTPRIGAVTYVLNMHIRLLEPARSQGEGSKSALLAYLETAIAIVPMGITSIDYVKKSRHLLSDEDRQWQDLVALDVLRCIFEMNRYALIALIHAFEVNWDDLTKESQTSASSLLS